MKKSIVLSSITAMFLTAVIIGCAQVPVEELQSTKALLDSARMAGAEKYMPTAFAIAQDTLSAAIAEIDKQKSESIFNRHYDRAKSLLTIATTAARNSQIQAPMIRQKMKVAIDTMFINATGMILEAKELLANAQKEKKNKAAVDSLGAELSSVTSSMNEAQTSRDSEDLILTHGKVTAGIEKLILIKEKLEGIIKESSSKGKKR